MSGLIMIIKEQLDEILKKHKAWVESDKKEGKMANLSYVNLVGANLNWANLSGADFSGSDLRCADLRSADLSDAEFRDANLCRAELSANFSGADLTGATLSRANLSDANLSDANLIRTEFFHANLRRADFSGATLSKVKLRGADLTNADLTAIHIDRETAAQIPDVLRERYEGSWIFLKDNSVIKRSINLYEYSEAGKSILKVTIIINTAESDREFIEETLDDYGLIITNAIEQLFVNKKQWNK